MRKKKPFEVYMPKKEGLRYWHATKRLGKKQKAKKDRSLHHSDSKIMNGESMKWIRFDDKLG